MITKSELSNNLFQLIAKQIYAKSGISVYGKQSKRVREMIENMVDNIIITANENSHNNY